MSAEKILFVFTSANKLGGTHDTGYYLPEAAHPYYYITKKGYEVDFASPKGSEIPLDESSKQASESSKDTESLEFLTDPAVKEKFASALKLKDVDPSKYIAVFYPGGHGPLVDLPTDPDNIRVAEEFYAQNKVVSSVCHGPGALVGVKRPDGKSIWLHQTFTGFSNFEEHQVKLNDLVPFSLEDRIKKLSQEGDVTTTVGATVNGKGVPATEIGQATQNAPYYTAAAWQPRVIVSSTNDGKNTIITGQNPASAKGVAEKLVEVLRHIQFK